MNKIIYIIAAALIAVSCENTLDTLWVHENKAILVLNAQLFQDDTSHRIHVGCSRDDGCEIVDNATVTYRINGGEDKVAEPIIVTSVDDKGEPKTTFYGYGFKAKLSPGDEIFMQASRATLTVTGTVKVPESAATITTVDTAKVTVPDKYALSMSRTRPARQYAITVTDKVGEKNYYLLRSGDVFYRLDASGEKVSTYSCGSRIDTSGEPILHSSGNLEDVFGIADILDSNEYDIFTDEMFTDASYTLKVTDRYYALSSSYRGAVWDAFWEGFETGDRYCLDRYFKVYTISYEEYIYLNAQSSYEMGYLDELSEPIVLPSNTEGGIGFVNVATPSVWTVHFPPQQFTGTPPNNPYRY